MSNSLMSKLGYNEESDEVKSARSAARLYSDVIDELVSCRERSGLKQRQVADLMRTSQSAVSEFESANADVRFSTLVRYVNAIGCELVIEITDPRLEAEPLTTSLSAVKKWAKVNMNHEGSVVPLGHQTGRRPMGNPSAMHYKLERVLA